MERVVPQVKGSAVVNCTADASLRKSVNLLLHCNMHEFNMYVICIIQYIISGNVLQVERNGNVWRWKCYLQFSYSTNS